MTVPTIPPRDYLNYLYIARDYQKRFGKDAVPALRRAAESEPRFGLVADLIEGRLT